VLALIVGVASAALGLVLVLGPYRSVPRREPIVAEYEGPSDVSIMTAAELLGVLKRAFPAGLIELAVAGRIRIVQRTAGSGDLGFGVQQVTPGDDEDRMMHALFSAVDLDGGPGGIRWLRWKDDILVGEIQGLTSLAISENRDTALRKQLVPAVATIVALLPLASALLAIIGLATEPGLPPLVALLVCAILFAISWRLVALPPGLTEKGRELVDRIEGIRLFLRFTDEERLKALTSDATPDPTRLAVAGISEALQPYAVLFGLEQNWAGVLTRYYAGSAPDWYRGEAPFDQAMGRFTSSVAAAYRVTRRR
jgi:hypothetical protein